MRSLLLLLAWGLCDYPSFWERPLAARHEVHEAESECGCLYSCRFESASASVCVVCQTSVEHHLSTYGISALHSALSRNPEMSFSLTYLSVTDDPVPDSYSYPSSPYPSLPPSPYLHLDLYLSSDSSPSFYPYSLHLSTSTYVSSHAFLCCCHHAGLGPCTPWNPARALCPRALGGSWNRPGPTLRRCLCDGSALRRVRPCRRRT